LWTGLLPYPWESCITATTSWSFTFKDTYKSGRQLIHMLVDIVAKGGNLLLNIGPGPDGTWQDDAYDRLRQIGDWMKVNSEAIYATRPVAPYRDGNIRLTGKKDGSVYAIYLGSDGDTNPPSTIRLAALRPDHGAKVTMLGVSGALSWKPLGNGMEIDIPASIRTKAPCKEAWTIRISRIQH
jgi:alpha-L-fucosidase